MDILVEFHHAPAIFEFVRLERHLGSMFAVKADLEMKSALKPEIDERILNEVVPV